MKLKLGEKVVVTQGVTMEENDWGRYQFPKIYCDGKRLAANVHLGMDDWADLDEKNKKWFVSADKGKSWQKAAEKVNDIGMVTTENGDRIYVCEVAGIDLYNMKQQYKTLGDILPSFKKEKAKPGHLPCLAGEYTQAIYPLRFQIYDFDLLPDELQALKFFTIDRIKKGESEIKTEKASIDYPHMPFSVMKVDIEKKATTLGVSAIGGNVRKAPDGTLWMVRVSGDGDLIGKDAAYTRYASMCLLVSEDNGRSWKFRSKVPYIPDINENPYAYVEGGYDEADFEFAEDGSAVMLMRVNNTCAGGRHWSPMYITHSHDNGYTWDKPIRFADAGVYPRMCKLGNGTIIAIYGRPGIYVRATRDIHAVEWDEPVEIMTPNDRSALKNEKVKTPTFHQWVGSCCNCYIAAVDDNTAIIIYSDFYYPDENGVKRKTIITQTVTVEE